MPILRAFSQEACRLLGTHLHVNRVIYGEIEGDDCTVVNDYVDGVPSLAGRFRWTDMGGTRTDEILKGGTLFVHDTSTEPHSAAEREVLQAAAIGAYICPLLVKDGRFVGAFGVHSREPRVWTAEEIALVQDVADRIWATLEHRKAEAELRTKEERLEFLLRLNDALRPLSDPGDVQETAARLLGQHLGVTRVGYAEFDGGEYTIRREYTQGVPPLAGQPTGHLGERGAARGAPARRDHRRRRRQTDPRLSDGDRTTMQPRQIAALIGRRCSRADGWSPPSAPITSRRASGRRQRSSSFATSANGPGTPSSAPGAKRRSASRNSGSASRSKRRPAAPGRGPRRPIRLTGTNNSVPCTGSRPMNPRRQTRGCTRVHEDDRPRLLALRDEMWTSRTKDSWESTFRIVRPDGTVAWIQSRGRVDRDADGNVTRLTGLDLDFSQHRRTEEARQARRDEEHDRALRTLLETATQGIVSVDAQGVIVTANHAFDAMFGWASGDLIGQRIERLLPSAFRDAHVRHRTNYSRRACQLRSARAQRRTDPRFRSKSA